MALAIAATELETALTALFGHDEAGWHEIGETARRRRGRVQLDVASREDILGHVVERKPQALIRPRFPLTESRTFLSGEGGVSRSQDNEQRKHSSS